MVKIQKAQKSCLFPSLSPFQIDNIHRIGGKGIFYWLSAGLFEQFLIITWLLGNDGVKKRDHKNRKSEIKIGKSTEV